VSEKLVISVDASKDFPDLMTVQDAFTHVLELFQLVGQSDPSSQSEVQWRLLSVNMNSPLTVTAEAVPPRGSGMPVDEMARRQKTAFSQNYRELKAGRIPAAWSAAKPRETANRILARNRNGIGRTTIDAGVGPGDIPITITKDDADLAIRAVERNAPPLQKTKEQMGSVEGTLVQIHQHYGHPAILILERKTQQEIWCVVPDEFQHQISESTSVEDVWKGSRVVVRGKITYGAEGKISRVIATRVRRIESAEVLESSIADRDFTGGLPVPEYLERLRDGNLG
jgi:hypothetical protein